MQKKRFSIYSIVMYMVFLIGGGGYTFWIVKDQGMNMLVMTFFCLCLLLFSFLTKHARIIYWSLHLVCWLLWLSSGPLLSSTIEGIQILFPLGISAILALLQGPIEKLLQNIFSKAQPKNEENHSSLFADYSSGYSKQFPSQLHAEEMEMRSHD
jgi:hypothetical protein